MEKNPILRASVIAVLLLAWLPLVTWGQCMYYPISLEERVANSTHIVIGRLLSQHSYWDRKHEVINTLNIIQVTAYLKGHRQDRQIGVITRGGTLESEAMISYPSLSLDPYNEYLLFLQGNNITGDHPGFRATDPSMIQAEPYADGQGAITKQSGLYHDLLVLPQLDETQLMSMVKNLTRLDAVTPEGTRFTPRLGDTFPLSDYAASQRGAMPITSFTPTTSFAGTIVPADFLTIDGSGFGAAAGTVFYRNADDGGATTISSGVATDNVAWSDVQIQNKIARRAGTGTVNVNGAMTSAGTLTVQYSHIDINNVFSGFASATRQRFYLRNLNTAGGYTFAYNTTFNADAAAKAAFERALNTWRCATFVNFGTTTTTTALATAVQDGTNCVFYNAGLPAGVLGRANSFFQASSSGGCTLANTVWWTAEIDIEFKPNPPSAGFTWEFGPAAPTGTEFDFESVALHELGHAHGLGHVIAPGTVMHFSISNGASVRSLNPNDIAGGNAKMAYSTAATCFNPGASGSPMVALTAGNCILAEGPAVFADGHHVQGIGNELHWSCQSHNSITTFEIERRFPQGSYQKLAEIPAMDRNDFSWTDRNVGSNGHWEYRILGKDQQGQTHSSPTISIIAGNPKNWSLTPSPTNGEVTIHGQSDGATKPWIVVLDLQGRQILKTTLETSIT